MLYPDLLQKYQGDIHKEFENILDLCLKHQNHAGDLLLWKENGFYEKMLIGFVPKNGRKLNPHVIGPGEPGHSEHTHYEFITQYRRIISDRKYQDYLDLVKYSPERQNEIDKLVLNESTAIQIEMLIYLKIFEADLFIKKMYELARIINGESYDWYFKVSESSRDKSATGTRQDIIRKKVRDKFAKRAPFLSDFITNIYKTQIRNSIAHSNYSIIGRNINLNNYVKEDPASQLHNLSFDEWHEMFHKLILFHNEYLWLTNIVNEVYSKKAMSGEKVDILITEQSGKQYALELEYRQAQNDWKYRK